MKLINKVKRFYYKIKNSDPLYKCKLYQDEGCAHVDGVLCNHPHCSIAKEYMGDNFVSCVNCQYQDECYSKQFGLGCTKGLKNEK